MTSTDPSEEPSPPGTSPRPARFAELPRSAQPTQAGPSDAELIRRAQRGEEDAFALLVRRHERAALRVALNLVARREDAMDLVQESFLRVFRSLDRFDFDFEFTTWLYRIVTNQAIDHLRRRRPAMSTTSVEQEGPELELVDARAAPPSAEMESRELAVRVRECIESLAPHFQSVLILREMEGLPCPEIARIVGATHVTVRWRLHRGRKLFQDEWERRERLRAQGVEPGSAFGARAGESDPQPARAGERYPEPARAGEVESEPRSGADADWENEG